MNRWMRWLGYFFLLSLATGLVYLYVWEKPKLELLVKHYIESTSKEASFPVRIEVGRAYFSLLPLQLEIHQSKITPKKDLQKHLKPFTLEMVAIRPSLLDLLVGKFWINLISIKGSEIDVFIEELKEDPNRKAPDLSFNLNEILKRVPISEVSLQSLKLNIKYADIAEITTEGLQLRAFNEKSSLIVNLKDSNLTLKHKSMKGREGFNLLVEVQALVTQNTLSLSKLALIKDGSYLISSGNMIFKNDIQNVEELLFKTRVKGRFEQFHQWLTQVAGDKSLADLKGEAKVDGSISLRAGQKTPTIAIKGGVNQLQIGKIKLGQIDIDATSADQKNIKINKVEARLAGGVWALIEKASVNIGDQKSLIADVEIRKFPLNRFLDKAGIAKIPVWLTAKGTLKCTGQLKEPIKITCPGALSVEGLKVMNGSRTRTIIKNSKVDVSGSMDLLADRIEYQAQAQTGSSKAKSKGVIKFTEGFKIDYDAEKVDLKQLAPIADLQFAGTGTAVGQVEGDSRWAIFSIDLDLDDFEFQDYFFGKTKTALRYKDGKLALNQLEGQLESTRFSGLLTIDLFNERIVGDFNIPFFRMEDIQQAIVKKVNLGDRFFGSGSGRVQVDTSFNTDLLNYNLEARLFKGSALGEEFGEAQLFVRGVDGVSIIERASILREKTELFLKGSLDQKFHSKLYFSIKQGLLQQSSILKSYKLPMSGSFAAQGTIEGPLDNPEIKFKSELQDFIFNKKKYGAPLVAFDNSNNQMQLQINLDEQLNLLAILPDNQNSQMVTKVDLKNFDVAPFLAYFISEGVTHRYLIEATGEMSGQIDRNDFWNSEFSAVVKDVVFQYKTNRINKTIPTSIELKNGSLHINEFSFIGDRQFIKVSQPKSSARRTQFVINSRLNIALFKIFMPFFERIDGLSEMRLELDITDSKLSAVGSAFLNDSFIKLPGFPHPLENITADILFNQNRIVFNSINAELAGGKVIGTGEIQLPSEKPMQIQLNSSLEGIDINFPEGFRTRGDATLSLSGTEPPFLLAGTYTVKDGLIDANLSKGVRKGRSDLLSDLLRQEAVAPLTLNIDVATEKSIELRTNVSNAIVEGYVAGAFRVFDKVNNPRLSGEAHFDRNSVIRLRDNQFQVTSSSFVFEGESPINPRLSLRANTRMNSYDIEINLQGRASQPLLTATSQPPLPSNQLISMLALGTLPDQFAQTVNAADANAAMTGTSAAQPEGVGGAASAAAAGANPGGGLEIGTALLGTNPIGRELDQYGVDVQFSSSFDDQNNAAVPKVTLRKRLGRKVQLSGSHSSGNVSQTEGRVTYEINNNLSTIFFVRDRGNDLNNTSNINAVRQNNPVGLDLEYRLEFD